MDDDTRVAHALGARIRALREGRGWTQERLAAEAGLHRTYLNGIEAGARNPALRNIVRLARALGVPVAALFADDAPAGQG